MHHLFRNPFFNFEVVRILGTTSAGGADVAECLEAIGKIRENDAESWHQAWAEQAVKAAAIADEAERHGHRTAARMAYLRASNYTRASAYMMTGDGPTKSQSDPRVVPILTNAVDIFHKATKLFDGSVIRFHVPFDNNLILPAYLYLPPNNCRLPGKIPLVVCLVGADSIQEEIYYTLPAAGPELGYAVLTFEGPGQGLMLHQHGIPMRPDWETVTDVVLDFLVKLDLEGVALDWERIAVAGASLGGYFALRVASSTRFDFKACAAVDPLYDLYDFATKHVAPGFFDLWSKGWISDWAVDSVIALGVRLSFQTKWEITTSSRFLGATTPTELLNIMRRFTLREKDGSVLDRLNCPVLVTGASDSIYLNEQDHTAVVFRGLSHPAKELWLARSPGEGSLQAKVGAMALCNQRVFLFLDERLGIQRHSLAYVQTP
ncbi:Alpha/Beta hydrolase protein [Podospora fimiseda]|uniref:Alpha/Beta hydrolase protein n=1 Tax=Podospora fimiseda TaxID=252190 RepID=A0AAN7BGN9_9PEZI|nr:Alpha/Beta hydrolase protein [Podospora fimiseda]